MKVILDCIIIVSLILFVRYTVDDVFRNRCNDTYSKIISEVCIKHTEYLDINTLNYYENFPIKE